MNEKNLTPISHGLSVLRLARLPKDYQEQRSISATQLDVEFALSSADKESVPPHLSVWVESYTTPEQAYCFLQENSPRKLVLRLKVDDIRQIIGFAGNQKVYSDLLNVLWVYIFNSDGNRDTRPGAKGHAGIIGVDTKPEELSNREVKNLHKDLRSKLAELASQDHWLLDDSNHTPG